MKAAIIIIIFFGVFSSCSNYRTISYRLGKSEVIYLMDIPKGYKFEGLAGSHELEKRFWYPDSSVIYITTFHNTINYNDIRKQGTYYDRFYALPTIDTLTLEGVDSLGLLWKDKKLRHVTVGYSKVPENKKDIFEKIIISARISK